MTCPYDLSRATTVLTLLCLGFAPCACGDASTTDEAPGPQADAGDTPSGGPDGGSAPPAGGDTGGSTPATAEGAEGQPTADGAEGAALPEGSESADAGPPAEGAEGGDPEGTYSYYRDVKPIMGSHCTRCHTEGGAAGFSLETYEAVKPLKDLVRNAVATRQMPPWQANGDCNEYHGDFSLTQEQIGTITGWADEGALAGDPADEVPPGPSPEPGLSRVDLELPLAEPYLPTLAPDEYRCFVLDWPETKTRYVTGFGVRPDQLPIVHHVIAYIVNPKLVPEAEALDASDPGQGYTCYGPSSGVGSDLPQSFDDYAWWVGAWAPGTMGRDFQHGIGLAVKPGSKIIVQIHYNLLTAPATPDRTSVVFKLDDEVEQPAYVLEWTNFNWLDNPMSMLIPAGDPDATHRWGINPMLLTNGAPLTIYSAMLHLHTLGRSAKLTLTPHTGGEEQCILDIPRWNFNWQLFYDLKKPLVVGPGYSLDIECHWDNTAENQLIVNGERLPPRDVGWGYGTTDEMCLGVMYVSFGN